MAALSGGFGGPMQMQQQHSDMFGMQASGVRGFGGYVGGAFGSYVLCAAVSHAATADAAAIDATTADNDATTNA